MKSILQATALPDFHLSLVFEDKSSMVLNYKPFIGKGVSAALADERFFRSFEVQDGFLVWPNGYDACPEALYKQAIQQNKDAVAA